MDDIVEKLRDPDYAGALQHLRSWEEIDRLFTSAADIIETMRADLSDSKIGHRDCIKRNIALSADNARLAKELEEARKALEPFSEYAGLYCSESSDNLPVSDDDFDFIAFLGDFRRAAAIRHKATVTTDDLPEGG